MAQRSWAGHWSDDPRQRLCRSNPWWLQDWQMSYLAAVREGVTIREATRRANIALSTLYRTHDEDCGFMSAEYQAILERYTRVRFQPSLAGDDY
jgi:hypothetical protein